MNKALLEKKFKNKYKTLVKGRICFDICTIASFKMMSNVAEVYNVIDVKSILF